jgi:hypothetical protein
MILNNIDIVTGWHLQRLADITIIFNDNCNMQFFEQQNIKFVKSNEIETIKKYKKIFVYTHDLQVFFETVYPLLNQFVLLTHNSDHAVTELYKKILDENKIIKWYAQNCYITHPKLISLPIGIANSRWQHGNLNTLINVIQENNNKEYLVYSNYDNSTNINERTEIQNSLTKNGILKDSQRNFKDYLTLISKSLFCIAPPGNGVDCHRVWECLYLNTIPVVKYHECFNQFKHLPILFIDNWDNVTIDFLKSQRNKFLNLIPIQNNELVLNYWKERINKGI